MRPPWAHDEDPIRISRSEVALACLIVGFVLAWWLRGYTSLDRLKYGGDPATSSNVLIEHDTSYVPVARPMIAARRLRARLQVKDTATVTYIDSTVGDTSDVIRDTLTAKPFTAQADTVAGRDTISLLFEFPPPRLSMTLHPGPDSIQVIREIREITIHAGPVWYEEIGKVLGGFLAGYGARLLTEPRR